MDHLENETLSSGGVPDPGSASDDEMLLFAQSFHGYMVFGGFKPVLEIVLSLRATARTGEELPRSLTVLRAALYGEIRSERQADLVGEELRDQRRYERNILRAIWELVEAGEIEDEESAAMQWLIETDAIRDQSIEEPYEDGFLVMGEPYDEELLTPSVQLTARLLSVDLRDGTSSVSEKLMRSRLICAISHLSHAVVRREQKIVIPGFQGVGPVDVVLTQGGGTSPVALIECKWSRDSQRDKIYEGAWDAIKLVLATTADPDAGAFLLTAAAEQSWAHSETADLFKSGRIDTRELWDRKLSPRGPNGGATVGADCLAGGHGNWFTQAPQRLVIEHILDAPVQRTDVVLKLARIRGEGALVKFAEAPEFPERIDQKWLDANVPNMTEDHYLQLVQRLKNKRWTDVELQVRVQPLREPE